ncbi:MAG: VCBS repeat-containing protein [Chloroflexota bacterium]|jgi:hypothetical protein
MKKLARILVMIGLIGTCAWLSLFLFNTLAWRLYIPSPKTEGIALADLDRDGDLDAFLANGRNEGTEPNAVLFNDGSGRFRDSGQQLGDAGSLAVVLHDFDDDGDVDALVSNDWGTYFKYFWNDGQGHFPRSQTASIPVRREGFFVGIWRFAVADLNEDTQADLFLVGCCGGGVSEDLDNWTTLNAHNTVWFNVGDGVTEKGNQQFGAGSSEAVGLADLDGDGDLDAFLANSAHLDEKGDPVEYDANEVWFNDGQGTFTDSGQQIGNQRSYSVAVGDLDGDGDPDALVGNRGPDEVWWNDGQGHFSQGDQELGNELTRYLHLADLDGDEDLDVFQGSDDQGHIWLNDGRGRFSNSGQSINYSSRHAIALGDVNGDGTVDVVAGRLDGAIVWFNDGTGRMRR